jgi:DNA-directed RNA polymerase sigma subunit (sigma70/sigma32)
MADETLRRYGLNAWEAEILDALLGLDGAPPRSHAEVAAMLELDVDQVRFIESCARRKLGLLGPPISDLVAERAPDASGKRRDAVS